MNGEPLGYFLAGAIGLFLLALPVLLYRVAVRRQGASWNFTEKVPLPEGGAYRGTIVDVTRTPGVPTVVRAVSMASLYMLVPAVVSVPLVIMGIAERSPAAYVFGPLGLLLAALVVAAGYRLPRATKTTLHFVRGVALLEIVHNVAVVAAVVCSSTLPREPHSWSAYSIDGLGGAAIPYALVSFAHAFFLLRACGEHARHVAVHAPADAVETPAPQSLYPAGG